MSAKERKKKRSGAVRGLLRGGEDGPWVGLLGLARPFGFSYFFESSFLFLFSGKQISFEL